MKKLLLTTALICSMSTGIAFADTAPTTPPPGGPHEHGFMENTLSKLPAADAATVRDTMKQAFEKNKPLFNKMHTLRQEREALMSAPKFDKDAYLAKSASLQKMEDETHTNMDAAFAAALTKLPADERKTLADSWGHFGEHHGMYHGDKPDTAPATKQ